jgi:hypothetical protein
MDTAWLNGKISVDHYRHTRPAYLRTLQQANAVDSVPREAPAEQGPDKPPGAEAQKEKP